MITVNHGIQDDKLYLIWPVLSDLYIYIYMCVYEKKKPIESHKPILYI